MKNKLFILLLLSILNFRIKSMEKEKTQAGAMEAMKSQLGVAKTLYSKSYQLNFKIEF